MASNRREFLKRAALAGAGVDPTIMAGPNGLLVGDLPTNRIATHLHGGLTPWFSDGTPFQWFTPSGKHGPSFMNVPGFPVLPGTGTYYYPNDMSARLLPCQSILPQSSGTPSPHAATTSELRFLSPHTTPTSVVRHTQVKKK